MEFITQLTSVWGSGFKAPQVSSPKCGLVAFIYTNKAGFNLNFALNGYSWDGRTLKALEKKEDIIYSTIELAEQAAKKVITSYIKKGKYLNN